LNLALSETNSDKNTPLGQILVGMGVTTEEVIRRVLSKKFGIPGFNLREFHIDPEAVQKVPVALAGKHRAMPLYFTESRMVVAIENPLARESLQDLQFSLQLKLSLSWRQARNRGGYRAVLWCRCHSHRTFLPSDGESNIAPEGGSIESDPMLVNLITNIVSDAIHQGASRFT